MTITIERDDLERAKAIASKAAGPNRWLYEDLLSAACEALTKAAMTYDGRGTWSGYSAQRMRWAALDEYKRMVGQGPRARAIKTALGLPDGWAV